MTLTLPDIDAMIAAAKRMGFPAWAIRDYERLRRVVEGGWQPDTDMVMSELWTYLKRRSTKWQ